MNKKVLSLSNKFSKFIIKLAIKSEKEAFIKYKVLKLTQKRLIDIIKLL